jgi:type IV pilus assembly protein PilM
VFKRSRSSKSAPIVGLDIDGGHVAAAQVMANGTFSVKNAAVSELPRGIMRDGELADPGALTEALRGFFAENGLPQHVRLGVASQRIVVRTLNLPPLADERALAAAVKVEAPDHIPMPIDEAVVDFQSLGDVDTPAGPRTRVVVVAARREMVERFAVAVADAGLRVEGIDLSAFAMVRALRSSAETDARLYVNLGGITNLAVANASGCLFARAASGGLDTIVSTLAERRALTTEHAAQWIAHVGLAADVDTIEGDPDLIATTRATLEQGVNELAETVRGSLNFYRSQEAVETVERGLVTGRGATVPGLVERLGEKLRLQLEAGVVHADDAVAEPSRLTVAAGLAVASRD